MTLVRSQGSIRTTKKNLSAAQSTVRQNKSGQTTQPNNKKKEKKEKKKENIVMAPTAMSSQYQNAAPAFTYSVSGDGTVKVRHREYVADVVSLSANYQFAKFAINPGLGSLFQWLQAIALSYESYVFNSLSFEFESTAATTDRGTLMMGIDFDASDSPPTNKQELMAYHGSVRSNVWSHACCRADSKDLRKFGIQRFVRGSAPLPSGSDIKTFDVGNFYVATQGTGVGITVGELYVTYDITLHTPQPVGLALSYNYSARFSSNDGVSTAQPLGLAFTKVGGLDVRWKSVNSFYCYTIGEFLIEMLYGGTSLDASDLITFTCPFGGTVVSQSGWLQNTSGTLIVNNALINVTASGCWFQLSFSGSSYPADYTFRIAPYPSSLG